VKEDKMDRTCSTHKGRRGMCMGFLVGKPEGKRMLHRWLDNIKMDLREIG
jgi:hypothetical protein